jgi:hypothetical protein
MNTLSCFFNPLYLWWITIIFAVFLIILFICWLGLLYYFKFKSKFWCIQPVFHLYDIPYYFYNKGIINKNLPEKNMYTDFQNIDCGFVSNTATKNMEEYLLLIQKYYFKNKEYEFYPRMENLMPYLKNSKTFVSFYFIDIFENTTSKIKKSKKMIGGMTSRPLHVFINKINKTFDTYYIDYLCVDENHRKKGFSEKIIQTHHYTQSHLNKKINVSIFKKENDLTGIIPLTIYKSFFFDMKNWNLPKNMNSEFIFLKINKQNMYLLNNFLTILKNIFDIFIIPDISDIVELIQTNNIYAYVIIKNNEILCVYFFKKTCIIKSNKSQFLSLFASAKGNNISNIDFIQGFKIALSMVLKEKQDINVFMYSHLIIEDISNNSLIIENLKLKTPPMLISTSAYFFYNYVHSPFHSKNVFIIS